MISHSLTRRPRLYDFPSEILATLPPSGKPVSLRILADDFGVTTAQVQAAIRRLKERFDLHMTNTAVSLSPTSREDAERCSGAYWARVWDGHKD